MIRRLAWLDVARIASLHSGGAYLRTFPVAATIGSVPQPVVAAPIPPLNHLPRHGRSEPLAMCYRLSRLRLARIVDLEGILGAVHEKPDAIVL